MKPHETIFAYGFVLARRMDPHTSTAQWSSCLGFSMLIVFNAITINNLIVFATQDRSLFLDGIVMMTIAPLSLAILSLVFLRRKTYRTVMKAYEGLGESGKNVIRIIGRSYQKHIPM